MKPANPHDQSPSELLAELEELSLPDRIAVILSDVRTRQDKFRRIDAFSLAWVLEVPQPAQPDNS